MIHAEYKCSVFWYNILVIHHGILLIYLMLLQYNRFFSAVYNSGFVCNTINLMEVFPTIVRAVRTLIFFCVP